jgi:hypothetical protein
MQLAIKFSVMEELWIKTAVFMKAHPDDPPNDPPNGEGHFVSNEAYDVSITADLYHFIPEKLHDMLENYSEFRSFVRISFLS